MREFYGPSEPRRRQIHLRRRDNRHLFNARRARIRVLMTCKNFLFCPDFPRSHNACTASKCSRSDMVDITFANVREGRFMQFYVSQCEHRHVHDFFESFWRGLYFARLFAIEL